MSDIEFEYTIDQFPLVRRLSVWHIGNTFAYLDTIEENPQPIVILSFYLSKDSKRMDIEETDTFMLYSYTDHNILVVVSEAQAKTMSLTYNFGDKLPTVEIREWPESG